MNISEKIRGERMHLRKCALHNLETIRGMVPRLAQVLESGGFPGWLDELTQAADTLRLLAAQDAVLAAVERSTQWAERDEATAVTRPAHR